MTVNHWHLRGEIKGKMPSAQLAAYPMDYGRYCLTGRVSFFPTQSMTMTVSRFAAPAPHDGSLLSVNSTFARSRVKMELRRFVTMAQPWIFILSQRILSHKAHRLC